MRSVNVLRPLKKDGNSIMPRMAKETMNNAQSGINQSGRRSAIRFISNARIADRINMCPVRITFLISPKGTSGYPIIGRGILHFQSKVYFNNGNRPVTDISYQNLVTLDPINSLKNNF
jgi:hypothetical protein